MMHTNLINKLYDTNYTLLCINYWHTKHSLRLFQFDVNRNVWMVGGPLCDINYIEQLTCRCDQLCNLCQR